MTDEAAPTEVFEAKGEGPDYAINASALTDRGALDSLPPERRARLLGALAAARGAEPGIELFYMGGNDGPSAWDVLFRCPNQHEFAECIGKSAENKKKSPEAMQRLAFQVVRFPSVESFRSMIAKRPGLALKIANDALAIASEEDPDFAKKV
jgi:hypothetical protein